ncbi:hypothetical protein chiPu_0014615 [Chiloscyllium punctatum]|uniref:Pseudouridine synthase RsuA/RluA-like domain-containing protein n=1 Tax=Chiloscyllium punctatum TaxID=137246 RepID=A0A401T0E8_CHIPU|nr:hypothetical protein [Chiloscyllium punctatum]
MHSRIGGALVCCKINVTWLGDMETARIDNLCILYQSSDFLVVNKHWDIRIDSKMWYENLTVQSQLKHRFPELVDPDTYYGFRFCHQLDFSTSGALCIAFSKLAAAKAYRCFRDRLVTKVYLALTEMVVLARGFYSGDPVTKVLLQPLTGRTHQLRVHCLAVGHPIVGDFTYSLKTDSNPYRMMLHAYYLRIPMEVELIEVTTADPFTHLIDSNLELDSWVNNLHDIIKRLSNGKSVMEQCDRDSMLGIQAEETPVKKTSEETEEEREKCLQWLSEWTMS